VIALQQRGEAVDQRRQATSQQIATQADLLAAAQPRESILLAAAAWRTWPTPTARGSLLTTQRQAYAGTFEPQREVTVVVYAPDGTLMAGGADGSVQTTTGIRFAAHPSGVRAMAFSPDGRRLLTAGDERTARLWDIATGRQITTFEETDPVNGAAFAPDGTTWRPHPSIAGSGCGGSATGGRRLSSMPGPR
jgi:WD40 repeat protein